MSHFDDAMPLFFIGGPIGLVIAIVAFIWAAGADVQSAQVCTDHGERYVDSRTGYTLCEQDGGMVVRR